ncbi:hypothetical protein BB737_06555 [Mycobacterium avium subsp. hominissuis]|nr:hypothetical protein BST19_19770 [Mycobacterium bouchedurhonense]ORW03725.1 hypothetical protein AWC14_00350 [Mycobacterium kyorinense]PBJ31906.1 hypothetical protein XV03_18820 [Mycobacterium avium subsp. hominissuis]PBJ66626.1 hypothetical protein BB737_06555 [Mycobacterium avium subsp. hominissuis]
MSALRGRFEESQPDTSQTFGPGIDTRIADAARSQLQASKQVVSDAAATAGQGRDAATGLDEQDRQNLAKVEAVRSELAGFNAGRGGVDAPRLAEGEGWRPWGDDDDGEVDEWGTPIPHLPVVHPDGAGPGPGVTGGRPPI